MTILKGMGSVLKNHITAVLIVLVFSVPLYYISSKFPMLYNVLVLLIYIGMIYSAGWNMGMRDTRKLPGYSPNIKRAVLIGLASASVTALLLLFRVAAPYIFKPIYAANPANGSQMELVDSIGLIAANSIYRLWLFPCTGFMPDGNFASYALMGLIIPVFVPIGYIVGLTHFSVLEKFYPKLVYKNRKKDNK